MLNALLLVSLYAPCDPACDPTPAARQSQPVAVPGEAAQVLLRVAPQAAVELATVQEGAAWERRTAASRQSSEVFLDGQSLRAEIEAALAQAREATARALREAQVAQHEGDPDAQLEGSLAARHARAEALRRLQDARRDWSQALTDARTKEITERALAAAEIDDVPIPDVVEIEADGAARAFALGQAAAPAAGGGDLEARVRALEEKARAQGQTIDASRPLEERVAALERQMAGRAAPGRYVLRAPRVTIERSPSGSTFRAWSAETEGQGRIEVRELRPGEAPDAVAPAPAAPPVPPAPPAPAPRARRPWWNAQQPESAPAPQQAPQPAPPGPRAPADGQRRQLEESMRALRAEAESLRADMERLRAEIERLPHRGR
jgi:uncharacterized protein (DUF736 family)